jgi:hypothetical protein
MLKRIFSFLKEDNRNVKDERSLFFSPFTIRELGGISLSMPGRIIFLYILLSLFSINLCLGNGDSNVSYNGQQVRGVYVDIIQVNLNSSRIKITPAVPKGFSDSQEYYPCQIFSTFINYYKPTAAINGTFFDMATYKPVGTIVIGGKLVNDGYIGTAVCIDKENQVTFHHVTGHQGSKIDWSPYEGAICSGPTLITEGEVIVNPEDEGFQDPAVFNANRRSAIGLTAYNKLLFVTVNSRIYLRTLAYIMQDLGCLYAVNLDGGTSCALYYRGDFLTNTSRPLSNVILIYENKKDIKVKSFR